MRIIRLIAVVCAMAMLLVACGGDGRPRGADGSGKPSPAASATAGAGATSSAHPTANPLGASTSGPEIDPSRGKPCDVEVQHSANAGLPGGTYISAHTRPPIRWGPKCEVLTPGDACEVQWAGSYVVMEGNEAHLRFQAWAKGQKKPFKELTAGPLAAEYQFRRLGFPVTIPDAEEVAFRIVLLNQAKIPVAISDSYSYKVKCKPE